MTGELFMKIREFFSSSALGGLSQSLTYSILLYCTVHLSWNPLTSYPLDPVPSYVWGKNLPFFPPLA